MSYSPCDKSTVISGRSPNHVSAMHKVANQYPELGIDAPALSPMQRVKTLFGGVYAGNVRRQEHSASVSDGMGI